MLLILWSRAQGQGYANLGSDAAGFAVPDRGRQLQFPADHGPHPGFRVEWWYLTANLRTASGEDLGVQWTLFRSALVPEGPAGPGSPGGPGGPEGWKNPHIWMGQAAVTTATSHSYAERLGRGGIGQAGVVTDPFSAWIDDWSLTSADDTLDNLSVTARGTEFSYDLSLQQQGPLILHGENGYSVKSEDGQASFYYSQPAYRVTGTVVLPDGPVEVTGEAWLDREWSSQPLAADQSGWDWFSLRFDSGEKVMGFVLRGERGDFTSGSWITADGATTPLSPAEFIATPVSWSRVAGRDIPTLWQVEIPTRGVSVEVAALNPGAWMGTSFSYWEGPVALSGSHRGTGYLEMTGYGDARSSNPSERK
ncbi:lipocalin-like domain-containing protein [Phaeobacter sp. B1627]|uniref:lipocalin-like domain-containing protein n=1 Tax=Phaeobacter sp. B1627 TaxID=2583809 RepID=UPI0021030B5C|nr:lipocalin-like domain-containing protein [Phaeobacter sp. B1627]